LSPKHRNLVFAGLLALSGCGFAPLYGDSGSGTAVAPQLEQVQVENIPDRPGQILRDSLQDDMQRQGAPVTQIYALSVSYNIAAEGIGIQADTSSTRVRYVASASWTLTPIGQPGATLASGQAISEDAQNTVDNQYFAQELATNTINRQLADELAAQITDEVAVYFKSHPQG